MEKLTITQCFSTPSVFLWLVCSSVLLAIAQVAFSLNQTTGKHKKKRNVLSPTTLTILLLCCIVVGVHNADVSVQTQVLGIGGKYANTVVGF